MGLADGALGQVFEEFVVPTVGSAPVKIAAGPDGALWFTEFNGNKIGRITTAGAVTEFTVPSASSGPDGIAAGPHGALWFAEFFGVNNIGRITTGGVITEFAIPTVNSGPNDITAGPDGALWFAENNGNKIGRITTAGAFTELRSLLEAIHERFALEILHHQLFGIALTTDVVERANVRVGQLRDGLRLALETLPNPGRRRDLRA